MYILYFTTMLFSQSIQLYFKILKTIIIISALKVLLIKHPLRAVCFCYLHFKILKYFRFSFQAVNVCLNIFVYKPQWTSRCNQETRHDLVMGRFSTGRKRDKWEASHVLLLIMLINFYLHSFLMLTNLKHMTYPVSVVWSWSLQLLRP